MNEWMNEWTNERMNERMNEWMNERMNEWTNERMYFFMAFGKSKRYHFSDQFVYIIIVWMFKRMGWDKPKKYFAF